MAHIVACSKFRAFSNSDSKSRVHRAIWIVSGRERGIHQKRGGPIQSYDCITEGIHFVLGNYDDGTTPGEIRRYALSPDQKKGAAWEFSPIFDIDGGDMFWRVVIFLEIRHERHRQDICTLVAAMEKDPVDRKQQGVGRLGGVEEKSKARHPPGPNLTVLDRKVGYDHKPLDKNGKAICYNFSAHSRCSKGVAVAYRMPTDSDQWGCNGVRNMTWPGAAGRCPTRGLTMGRPHDIYKHRARNTHLIWKRKLANGKPIQCDRLDF